MNRRFGNYILQERIGIGGMGEVFRARKQGPEGFEVEVALKVILPHLSKEKQFRRRFIREAKLAASLKHPNIVQVNGFDIIEDTPFIEMEYLPGADLRRILRSVPSGEKLSLEESVAVLYAVAGGLEHAHRVREGKEVGGGIVHCDLNPHNILISTLGEVKVTDFGIARAVLGDSSASATVRGKLAYMSPEQMEGRELDRRTDLFSLGIIAYQLLSGDHPFIRGSEGATITAIGKARHLPLRDKAPDLPATLYELVDRLLSLDPEQRPDSASEILKTLQPMVLPSATESLATRVRSLASETPGTFDTAKAPHVTASTKPRTVISRSWPYLAMTTVAFAVVGSAFLLPLGIESGPGHDQASPADKPQPPPEHQVPAGAGPLSLERTVTLETNPPGARILADGVFLGNSPILVKSRPDGSMPALEARRYGYRTESFRIPSKADKRFVINLLPLPAGTVRISAIPWARVIFRGEDKGDTPVIIGNVPVGEHTFILSYDPLGVRKRVVVDVKEELNTVAVDMREGR